METKSSQKSDLTTTAERPAPHSWREGIENLWSPSKVSDDESPPSIGANREDSTGNSEADMSDPNLPVAERTSRRPSEAPDSPVELPASPVSAPGNSRSFFDTDSESEEDGQVFPIAPVITRASSVRVQRPILVQHRSADSTRLLHRLMGDRGYPAQRGLAKAEQTLGYPVRNLPSAANSDRLNAVEQTIIDNPNSNRDILQATPESLHAEFGMISTPEMSPALQSENISTIALAPIPPPSDLSFTPSSIIEVPNTPLRREALDTLPSALGGFGTIRAPVMHSSRLATLAVDGLRSNPLSQEEMESVNRLHRTASAPTMPSKMVKDLRRKVTIQPLDTTSANHLNNGRRSLFRESIVSTPYPSRATSLHESHVAGGPHSAKLASTVLSDVSENPENAKAPLRDRFPSVVTNEILRINIAIARHPLDTVLVEIRVEDRGTFDDEQLFTKLRASYYNAIGLHCRALPRKISFVSCSSLSDQQIPVQDFITHFLKPKIGHKRKTWLLWLRSTQPITSTQTKHTTAEDSGADTGGLLPDSQVCDFTLQTTPKTALTVLKTSERGDSRSVSPIDKGANAGGTFLASPSSQTSPLSEKLKSTDIQRQSRNIIHDVVPDTTTDVENTPSKSSSLPTITFHHTDSVSPILFGLALTFLLSALATIFWILFGVPGKSAADGNSHRGRRQMGWRWQEDAQRRVLVGFVFGIFTLVGGLIVDGVWVFVGRTLL